MYFRLCSLYCTAGIIHSYLQWAFRSQSCYSDDSPLSPFFSPSLSPLFKVHKSISWSLDTAVQRLLVQKRNTDNLLLGNKLRIVSDNYFGKSYFLADSRSQNNTSAMQVYAVMLIANVSNLRTLKGLSGAFSGSYIFVHSLGFLFLFFLPFCSVLLFMSSQLHLC